MSRTVLKIGDLDLDLQGQGDLQTGSFSVSSTNGSSSTILDFDEIWYC